MSAILDILHARENVPLDDLAASVPLAHAALCPECDVIYNNQRGACPRCSDPYGYLIVHWLNSGASA